MDLDFDTSSTLIEDVTLPSLLTSFSTTTNSSVEFTTSESESDTTQHIPVQKQKPVEKSTYKGPVKSFSLADLTTIKSFKSLMREDSAIYSTETLTSAMTTQTDSGIHHSNGCINNTGNNKKKFAHVESKVKQYIKNIKDNEAKSRANRLSQPLLQKQQDQLLQNHKTENDEIICLKNNLKKLEIEILEKNRLIEQLQYNYKLMENKYNSATNLIRRLAEPSRDLLKFTENEVHLYEQLSPAFNIPPPEEVWGRSRKCNFPTTSTLKNEKSKNEKENTLKVRKVKSGGDLVYNSNVDVYKTLRDSRHAIQKVKLWQESLTSTDVSGVETDNEINEHSPHSCSISFNDLSLSSLEISPVTSQYPKKQESRSDSSGCGMSSTRLSKENTLISGVNVVVNDNKDYHSTRLCHIENVKPSSSSTPIKSISYSSIFKDSNKIENKKIDAPQKRCSNKKLRKTKSKNTDCECTSETDEFMGQFKHCIGVINGVVSKMEQSFKTQR
ncbi:uncharacterized protein LOC126902374 [Daktulosphaira vitifoliae]|uniref:uncharacterized protein LOC126902374 n=1 Tax=Daktulosphaira vitifoliae TaxID=58002 RepID=UPI0021AA80DD|nr:uncharacterized protein LOC126902374 [Daktulosphaira vitifoliae]XP_050535511.1 uncharacterized protein LOC126902374 [Daktulosphaira vitifoliae]